MQQLTSLPDVRQHRHRRMPDPWGGRLGADRIAAAIRVARTESTQTVYAHAWRVWERWYLARGIAPLPGDPVALCAYLAERAESGIAMITLDAACTAIRHVHRMCAADRRTNPSQGHLGPRQPLYPPARGPRQDLQS